MSRASYAPRVLDLESVLELLLQFQWDPWLRVPAFQICRRSVSTRQAPRVLVSLSSQMLGENVRQHIVCSDEDHLDFPQFDRLSEVMDLHVDVLHLSNHGVMRSLNSSLVVAEHVQRLILLTGDLVEQVSERKNIITSVCDTAV